MEVSTDWYVTVECWGLSSIRVIFVNYCCGNHLSQGQMISLTSKPQRKYDVEIHKRTRQGASS